MTAVPEREDERVRFGREPASLEEMEYLGSQVPGADEYPHPKHPAIADQGAEREGGVRREGDRHPPRPLAERPEAA